MRWVSDENDQHPEWLQQYVAYLADHCKDFLDIEKLNHWTSNHTIEANIPIGYGLGSSGALTAAIFDLFARNKEGQNDVTERLGLMESFFHGQSSGFDPLISYLDRPILKKKNGALIELERTPSFTMDCYLLDSGSPREGKSTITEFIKRAQANKTTFNKIIELNNQLIGSFIHEDKLKFKETLIKVSQFQFEHMDFMIPDHLKEHWQSGIENGESIYKICGAGGGGYFFLFSDTEVQATRDSKLERVILN